MFADEGIRTKEKEIWEYLGEEARQEAKKVTGKEREEMDKVITPGRYRRNGKKPEK